MRTITRIPIIASAVLFAGSAAAQSCVRVIVSSNWGATHRVTQFTPTTFAILVPGLPQPDSICGVELFCWTRSASPVQMPVWIYDRSPTGGPGSQLANGTMTVGTTAAGWSASLQTPIPANADFFIVFDNAVGNLRPPIALGGTPGVHYHSGPAAWSGPFTSAAWMYRVYSGNGSVRGTFATTGLGCAGAHGVPRIDAFGSPVTGSVFQVTLAQAPSSTVAAQVVGLSAFQLDLGGLGAPGCLLEQIPVVSSARTTGSTGAASFPYFIPNDPTLVSAQLHVQWIVVDPGANPLGISLSPGGIATIGDF